MNIDKIKSILAIVGAFGLGLPLMLQAMQKFLMGLPFEHAALDAALDKVEKMSEKIAGFIQYFYPKSSQPQVPAEQPKQ